MDLSKFTEKSQAALSEAQNLADDYVGVEHGDLYAVVVVQLPEQVSDEERALWEKLSRVSHFNPRL
jgi:DnaJ-class molecular chaperone